MFVNTANALTFTLKNAKEMKATGIIEQGDVDNFQSFIRFKWEVTDIELTSSGCNVSEAMELGYIWREMGLNVKIVGRCESMCPFLALGGAKRSAAPDAYVSVHQIWLKSKVANALLSEYTGQDIDVIQKDIGKLARYIHNMGGSGMLVYYAMQRPPWESLRKLSRKELRETNLIND